MKTVSVKIISGWAAKINYWWVALTRGAKFRVNVSRVFIQIYRRCKYRIRVFGGVYALPFRLQVLCLRLLASILETLNFQSGCGAPRSLHCHRTHNSRLSTLDAVGFHLDAIPDLLHFASHLLPRLRLHWSLNIFDLDRSTSAHLDIFVLRATRNQESPHRIHRRRTGWPQLHALHRPTIAPAAASHQGGGPWCSRICLLLPTPKHPRISRGVIDSEKNSIYF